MDGLIQVKPWEAGLSLTRRGKNKTKSKKVGKQQISAICFHTITYPSNPSTLTGSHRKLWSLPAFLFRNSMSLHSAWLFQAGPLWQL